MKVGDEYYDCWVDLDEGCIGVDLWIITKIAGPRAFAIKKTPYTWVKVSTKTGDYGWAKRISDFDRAAFAVASGPPDSWAKTKAAAYTKALPAVDAAIKRLTRVRATIAGQRTRARTR